MKVKSVVLGGLLAGVLFIAGSGEGSANMTWCMSDPPIQVVTPGGHYLVINNVVYLPPSALHLKNKVWDEAVATPNGRGGTHITVYVHVPDTAGRAHVISSSYRYRVATQEDGVSTIRLDMDVPTT